MARRDWALDDDLDDELDVFVAAPTSSLSHLGAHHAELLGLSEDEARLHRVRPLEIGDGSGEAEPALPAPRQVPQWAAQRGLGHVLARRGTELEPWLGWAVAETTLGRITVEDCLRGRLSILSSGQRAVYGNRLSHAARAYVADVARGERMRVVRERLWARAPAAELAALAGALRRLHAALCSQPARERELTLVGAVVAVGEEPPRVVASFPEGYARVELPLALVGDGSQALEPRCSCHVPRCRHGRVLVEAVLDAVHGGTPLSRELSAVLAVPSWQRLLGALARTRRPEAARAERVTWRIGRARGVLTVQPMLQQCNSRGQWSSGRKLSPDAAARRAHGAGEERDALSSFGALGLLGQFLGAGEAQARLLQALVGHPRLCSLEPPHEPLSLDTARATIVAQPVGESIELALAVGERRVAPAALESSRLDARWGLFIEGGRATLYELPAGVARTLAVLSSYGTRLPPEAHAQAADVLLALSREVPLELPLALRGETVASTATFVLRLVPIGPCALGAELLVRLVAASAEGAPQGTPLGPEQVPGEGDRELSSSVGGRRVCTSRDLDAEAERARSLAQELALPSPPRPFRWELEGDAALELVHRSRHLAAADARALSVEWPASEPWQTKPVGKRDLRVKLERTGQWFAVGGGLEVDGVEAGLAELLSAVRAGQRFVRLGPGRFARVAAELAAAARGIDDLAHSVGGQLAVAPVAALGLEALALPQLDAAEEWWALRARVAAAARLEPEVPSALRATLRHYQLDGYRWLARLSAWDAGACLADDMGLGKTVQSIALLLSRPGPHLVVAPTSVGPNWLREAEAFAPSLRARLYRGPERASLLSELGPSDVLITSYDVLALDVELLAEREFDTLVLDEAQAVKNARTRRARAARAVRARFKLALTGTPVENHLGDLWSILSIVSPGLLGPWEHFRDRFATPIERDGDRARLEALSALLRPFVLRRTKALVAPELPPRTTVIEPVELSRRERALYEAARQSALAELADAAKDERSRIQVLAALTRLRRLACHPALVVSGYTGPGSKLQALLGLIAELRATGQRALVFSQFTSFLALVRQALEARGIDYLYLDGRTPVSERAALVGAWREARTDLFLLSLKAGGSGLNLIGADAVIHLDPWWNPAVEDQATDRTHRIGQARPVTAIRLIAQGTIEEAVLALHEGKRALADGLLAGTDAAAKLSSAELIDLIRFGEAAGAVDADEEAGPEPREGPGAFSTAALASTASPPAARAKGRAAAPARGKADRTFAAPELASLRQRLARQLRRDELSPSTVSAYLRAFDRVVALAEAEPAERTLLGWYEACLGRQTGTGPQSQPAILRAVIGRAQRLA